MAILDLHRLETHAVSSTAVLWAIAAGGGYGSVGDFRIFNDGPAAAFALIMTGHWHDAPEYGGHQAFGGLLDAVMKSCTGRWNPVTI